jgi:hypothetical protein
VRRKSQKKKRAEVCEKETSRFFGVLKGRATEAGKRKDGEVAVRGSNP